MRDNEICVSALELPSFLYEDPADYDPNNMEKGLCMGHLLINVSVFDLDQFYLTYSADMETHLPRATISPGE